MVMIPILSTSTGSPVVGTNQTFTATSTGTYYVSSVSTGVCKSIKEEITVIPSKYNY
jgi:hypothetical protein